MNQKESLSWYGLRDIEEYLSFISKHPPRLFSYFMREPKEITASRKMKREGYERARQELQHLVPTKLLPILLKKASYASFTILHADPRITLILEKERVNDRLYRNSEPLTSLILSAGNPPNDPLLIVEDHTLFDENCQPFFTSITHEGIFHLKATEQLLQEITASTALNFDYKLDSEPPL